MQYVSTRGDAPVLDFEAVLLAGLAADGGLYVPSAWPHLSADDLRALQGRTYSDIALEVMGRFVGDTLDRPTLARLIADAYAGFGHRAVAPLVQLDRNTWLMELFHGPTLAFKDYALQLVGRLFDHFLARRGRQVTIVGATSGDTGSAAIEACRDRSAVTVFILHPQGRVSEVQRRQMTTVLSANVHNIAIEGSFDDCQDRVKAMFTDAAFRSEMSLSAVNSINWARIAAQIAYYVAAAVALGAPDRAVAFSVPTGNFGNVYAAYAARQMGVPIERLIVGANSNDILDRFFRTGQMRKASVTPTLSPAMDIQISSNFERLLFDLEGRDGAAVADQMARFRRDGTFAVSDRQLAAARAVFTSERLDDDGIRQEIARTHEGTGMIVDPHTAVGLHAARAAGADLTVPLVSLACAHPAKFPEAVEAAIGQRPVVPPRLHDLFDRQERLVTLPADLRAVQEHIRSRAPVGAAA